MTRSRIRTAKAGAAALTAAAALVAVPVAGAQQPAPHGQGQSQGQGNGSGYGQGGANGLVPGSLVISGSTFPSEGVNIVAGQTQLNGPVVGQTVTATAGGQYPEVFNNDGVDGSFAVNTPVELWDVGAGGQTLGQVTAPTSDVTTSFSSKSELAVNYSTDGRQLSFLGYNAAVGALDASNSSTPGVPDPTNPDVGSYYRIAASLGSDGRWTFTDTNAFSGDNGRAVLLDSKSGDYYAVGNSNNGTTDAINTDGTPDELADSAGAQVFAPSTEPESTQDPGLPDQLGPFSVSQLGPLPAKEKVTKDDNFRGLTDYDGVVYFTKGSGSNGVDTVYFVDTTNTACPTTGVGDPVEGAPLPATAGGPYTICVLNGFNAVPNRGTPTPPADDTPFGIWFANQNTLYVGIEGSGDNTYDASSNTYVNSTAAAQPDAGLQKWVRNQSTGVWSLAYTVQAGLNLGQPYTVPGYPTGDNASTGLPWAPATAGLRNIAGRINPNGTVTIYAATATVSGGGDQGADPNQVVAVTDEIGATTDTGEQFTTVRDAVSGDVYRGVAIAPGDNGQGQWPDPLRSVRSL
jgi:hypothetical protein